MPQPVPYLAFDGSCADAMRHCTSALGGTLDYETIVDAERACGALAEGGTVQMSMQPTFWASTWGMLIDRFGTPWIVNGELLPLA